MDIKQLEINSKFIYLKRLTKKMNETLLNGNILVVNHCASIKNQIQHIKERKIAKLKLKSNNNSKLNVQELIESLEKSSDQALHKVESYEKFQIEARTKNNTTKSNEWQKKLNNQQTMLDLNWQHCLLTECKNIRLDFIQKLTYCLETDLRMLRAFLFNYDMIYFYESQQDFELGWFYTERFYNMKSISKIHIDHNYDSNCNIKRIKLNEKGELGPILYIRDKKLTAHFKIKSGQELTKIICDAHDLAYYECYEDFYLITIVKKNKDISEFVHLILDLNFNKISQIVKQMHILFYTDQHFYFRDNKEIKCYDKKFIPVNDMPIKFQQEDPLKPFYINDLCCRVVKKYNKFVLLDPKGSTILDASDGLFITRIPEWVAFKTHFSKENILVTNTVYDLLVITQFDWNFRRIREITLYDRDETNLVEVLYDNLFFFVENKKFFYSKL